MVIGGDGMLYLVVNVLMMSDCFIVLIFVGIGNDFVCGFVCK